MMMQQIQQQEASSSSKSQDLSFTILWSPLPPITWFIPFIGHTGIGNSRGVGSDFQGPFYVGDQGRMAFGPPTRALKLDIGALEGGAERWDEAIQEANEEYRGRMHNICCDNCHSHVAYALNRMPLKAPLVGTWNMILICFYVFFRARFLSWQGFVAQFGPFLVILLIWTIAKSL